MLPPPLLPIATKFAMLVPLLLLLLLQPVWLYVLSATVSKFSSTSVCDSYQQWFMQAAGTGAGGAALVYDTSFCTVYHVNTSVAIYA
jgi:hypothetical protein